MLSYESDVGAALGRAWVVLEAKSNLHCAKPKYAVCYMTFVASGGGLWGQTLDAEGLIAFCRERLAGFKVPKRVVSVDKLPKNASSKILKRQLRLSIGQG